jgi:hypothetical protein
MTQEQSNEQAAKEVVNPLKAKLEAAKLSAVSLTAKEGEALPEEPAIKPAAEEPAEEPEEKSIPEILAAMKTVAALGDWTPPKGSFKALKLKQLLLKNRKVKPNEFGYYVVAEDDKEALTALNYFADLNYGYVERV